MQQRRPRVPAGGAELGRGLRAEAVLDRRRGEAAGKQDRRREQHGPAGEAPRRHRHGRRRSLADQNHGSATRFVRGRSGPSTGAGGQVAAPIGTGGGGGCGRRWIWIGECERWDL